MGGKEREMSGRKVRDTLDVDMNFIVGHGGRRVLVVTQPLRWCTVIRVILTAQAKRTSDFSEWVERALH